MSGLEKINPKDERDRGQRFMQEYSRINRRLYGFIISLVADFSMADDIVQDTLSIMWLKFDDYRPGSDFCAWAFKIARYRVLYYRRRQIDMKNRFSDQTLEKLALTATADSKHTDDRRDMLKLCLSKLKQAEREILHLRYEEGASLKKVASRINLNINTLYKKVGRIHVALLKCIQSGTIPTPSLAPAQQTTVTLGYTEPASKPAGAEYFVTVCFKLAEDTLWAQAGHIVAWDQVKVPWNVADEPSPNPAAMNTLILNETPASYEIAGSDFSVTIGKTSGAIESYISAGHELIVSAIAPNFWRVPTDNDVSAGMANR